MNNPSIQKPNRNVVKINPDGSWWIAPDITAQEAMSVLPSLVQQLAVARMERTQLLKGVAQCPSCLTEALIRASDSALLDKRFFMEQRVCMCCATRKEQGA